MVIYLFAVLCVFIFFGMDIRPKSGAKSFTPQIFIIMMKISCFILFILYSWSLIHVQNLETYSVVTAIFTTLGAALVMWAKITLGKSFTWTGYYIEKQKKVSHGPYRYVKHPLYYGVFLFEIGAVINYVGAIFNFENFWLYLIFSSIPLIYAISFNLLMAKNEEKHIYKS